MKQVEICELCFCCSPLEFDIEVQSKSTATNWHLQNMEAIGMDVIQNWLNQLFTKSANFEKEIEKLTDDPNIARAFGHLRGSGDLSFKAWRWISGQKLSGKELQEIKVDACVKTLLVRESDMSIPLP